LPALRRIPQWTFRAALAFGRALHIPKQLVGIQPPARHDSWRADIAAKNGAGMKRNPVVDRKAMEVAAEDCYQANLLKQAEDILRSWGEPGQKRDSQSAERTARKTRRAPKAGVRKLNK